jgi:gamma-glutamylcyclotransferase
MYYFAFGSNLSIQQMKERCPDSIPKFRAYLQDYKLIFAGHSVRRKGGIASIKSFSGEKVKGAIYEVTEDDLRLLDKYEGYPNTYCHLNIKVCDDNGKEFDAMTYILHEQSIETRPSKEYIAVINQGYGDWNYI